MINSREKRKKLKKILNRKNNNNNNIKLLNILNRFNRINDKIYIYIYFDEIYKIKNTYNLKLIIIIKK
jgi:hypothetical protein